MYVSDTDNHRVMTWLKYAKEGTVVAGGNGQENSLTQLSLLFGIVVEKCGQIYVADSLNHQVVRWSKGTIGVGGNGEGERLSQFRGSINLSFDRQGDLYVVDLQNNRIQKFEIDFD
jgi:hypothetical protein